MIYQFEFTKTVMNMFTLTKPLVYSVNPNVSESKLIFNEIQKCNKFKAIEAYGSLKSPLHYRFKKEN